MDQCTKSRTKINKIKDSNALPQSNQAFEESRYKEVWDDKATIFLQSIMPLFLVSLLPSPLHPCEDCFQPLSCQIQLHTWNLQSPTAPLTFLSGGSPSISEVFHAMFQYPLELHLQSKKPKLGHKGRDYQRNY